MLYRLVSNPINIQRKIIAEDTSTLEFAQQRILRYLRSTSAQPGHVRTCVIIITWYIIIIILLNINVQSATRLNFTYFHPDGVEQSQLYQFKQRKYGRQYEVDKVNYNNYYYLLALDKSGCLFFSIDFDKRTCEKVEYWGVWSFESRACSTYVRLFSTEDAKEGGVSNPF